MRLFSSVQFSSVHSLSRIWLFLPPRTAARQASLSITISWSLPKIISIELVMPSNQLILCGPRLFLPSIFSCIRVSSKHSISSVIYPILFEFFPFENLFAMHSSYVPIYVFFSHTCWKRYIRPQSSLLYRWLYIIIRYLTIIYYVKCHMYFVCLCVYNVSVHTDTLSC